MLRLYDPRLGSKLTVLPKDSDLVVLIDVSNLAWRAHHAYSLTTSKGNPSGHVYGSVRLLLNTLRSGHCSSLKQSVIYCYDGASAKAARREVLPGYKMSRDSRAYSPVPEVEAVLRDLPGLHIKAGRTEADDVMVWASKFCPNPVLVSSDKDLWAIQDRAKILIPKTKVVVTSDMILEKFGVNRPDRIYLWKAIFGDTSDDIYGPSRLPKASIIPAINLAEDLEHFWRLVPDLGLSPKTYDKLVTGRSQIEANYAVVKPWISELSKSAIEIQRGDPGSLRRSMLDYECVSLLEEVDWFFR